MFDTRSKTNGDDTKMLSKSPSQFSCNLGLMKNISKISNVGVN